jgi:ComF family protein
MKFLSDRAQFIVDFVYPLCCIVCDAPMSHDEKIVCPSCWSRLRRVEGIVEQGIIERSHIDEIRSGVYYDEIFQTLMHHFKYQRAIILAERFAEILAQIIVQNEDLSCADWLVPVPLHKIKLRERSYNQSEELCRSLSRRVKIPLRLDIVARVVATESQTKMATAKDRVLNMHDVFQVRKPLEVLAKRIILVDDLITTGATANSCAGALKRLGAKTIHVLTAGRPMPE